MLNWNEYYPSTSETVSTLAPFCKEENSQDDVFCERLIRLGARQHDAAKWQMFNHIILFLRHSVDAARGCRCVQVREVIAMIAVTN